jgi:hypothetical protein
MIVVTQHVTYEMVERVKVARARAARHGKRGDSGWTESMRTKMWWGLAGGGAILLVGMVIGALLNGGLPAWALGASPFGITATPAAGSNTSSAYCQLYLQRLASALHVDQSTLASDNQAALKAVIQQEYQDKKITQAQETALLNRVNQLGSHPCAGLGRFGRSFGPGPGRGLGRGPAQELGSARQALLSAVAASLKLTPSQLQSDLASGQTLQQLATSRGVSFDSVKTAYLNAVQAQLKQAVSAGTLTQAQSDQLWAAVQRSVAAGHFPLIERPNIQPAVMQPMA